MNKNWLIILSFCSIMLAQMETPKMPETPKGPNGPNRPISERTNERVV